MTIKKISELIINSDKPHSALITKSEKSKLIAIGLGKNVVLSDHKAPGPTTLIVVQGIIEYKTAEYSRILNQFDEFIIPHDELHSARGIEASIFLLSVNN